MLDNYSEILEKQLQKDEIFLEYLETIGEDAKADTVREWIEYTKSELNGTFQEETEINLPAVKVNLNMEI